MVNVLHKVVLAFCDWYQVQTATTYVMYHLRFGKNPGSTWGVLLHYARPWDIDTYVSTSDVRNFEIPSKTVHTVSFDWFLSGLVWILNLEFWLTKNFDILPEIILEYLFQPNVSTASFSARRACSDVYLEINTEGKMAAWRLRWPRRRQQEANNSFFSFL